MQALIIYNKKIIRQNKYFYKNINFSLIYILLNFFFKKYTKFVN